MVLIMSVLLYASPNHGSIHEVSFKGIRQEEYFNETIDDK